MAGRLPEERVQKPVTRQWWGSLTFLHWAFEPDVIQDLLPAGVEVDTWDGWAWVSMTPFVMTLRHRREPGGDTVKASGLTRTAEPAYVRHSPGVVAHLGRPHPI